MSTTTTDKQPVNGASPSLAAPIAAPRPGAAPAPKQGIQKAEPPKVVGKMEAIEVHANDLLAALLCVAKGDSRYYLEGVYIHRTADGFVRAVATDGHRCLIANLYREHKDKPGPKWLDKGIIVPAEGLAQRVKLIVKAHDDELLGVKIAYGENQPRIEISDHMGVNVFRVQPVDGEYPAYENVTIKAWSGAGSQRADWKPTAFKPAYLKAVADVAKALGSDSIECFDYATPEGGVQPVLFTFGKDADGVALFLMPMVGSKDPGPMGKGNQLLLAPAVKLTIAALRAHETRNRDAAKGLKGDEHKAALAKADEFAARIRAVLENQGSGTTPPALPAPKPPKPKKAAKAKAPKAKADPTKGARERMKAGEAGVKAAIAAKKH